MIILVSLPAMSQGRKYQKGMLKAIQQMSDASDPASLLQLVTSFEEFAQSNPTQWIPSYYASYILITTSFAESDLVKDELEKIKDVVIEE